ncbi:hypothetical protein [Tahibacter harae]|uniref:Uncharacterized protein n=1 Tax=Tahibacter harae TaxID=2963937 RepID=A0ABT1QR11_9GAMM|nr:hypothetical protein [Tahibacter harae]MCQ4164711.1 hypothetical protein [Tahibacter harae]
MLNTASTAERVPLQNRLVIYFQFCISQRGGIGPVPLRKLWETVARSRNVKVSRALRSNSDGFIYSLAAASGLDDLARVEAELRQRLVAQVLGEVTLLTRVAG